MTTAGHAGHAATLRDYLHVVRRRKWITLQAALLVPAAAIAFSVHQQKLYQASAQVLLSSQNLATELTGTQQTGVNVEPDRVAQTQADVARVPAIGATVLRHVPGTGLTVQQFLNRSSVSTAANADILTFEVVNRDAMLARRLVDEYAASYTVYRRNLDTAAIHTALKSVDGRIAQLVGAGGRGGALYASLVERQQTLATMQALQTSNAAVVQQAQKAVQVQPKTSRNAILGIFLGILLGIGLAFLREALDTRVRSAEEIGERLGGLPLLARVPVPSRKLRVKNRLVMLESPTGVQAEAFRMLRTNLDFATLGRNVRTIMVTSAVEQEGKSTTIANLAVALARTGQRVALVDLDLRRPFLHTFFDLNRPGITQVALGHISLEEALVPIAIADSRPRWENGNGNGNGHNGGATVKGILEVLPSGPIPPDPGEFVGTAVLGEIIEELRMRADFVLLDAPPALHVGDAMTLSTRVDGILVVTRMQVVRRHMLNELARQLANAPTPVLGFVVTAADEEESYGYGYGYGYGSYHTRAYERSEKAAAGSHA